jgi:hypothetical protein
LEGEVPLAYYFSHRVAPWLSFSTALMVIPDHFDDEKGRGREEVGILSSDNESI